MSDLQSSTDTTDETDRADDPSLEPAENVVSIAVAESEGADPEITAAVRAILEAAGARVAFDPVTVRPDDAAEGGGIPASAWDAIRRHRVLLLGPMEPAEDGQPDPRDALRRSLGLLAGVRSIRAWPQPNGEAATTAMDLVIVGDEDASTGLEARATPEVVQSGGLASTPGLEQLLRYGFDLAVAQGRRCVHCVVEPGAGAMATRQLHGVFQRLAAEHPEIESELLPADRAAAQLIERPQSFGVVVAPGPAGVVLARLAEQLSGSPEDHAVARIGERFVLFEASRGPARESADPSGLLRAAIELLQFIGDRSSARTIHHAWLAARVDGLRAVTDADTNGRDHRTVGAQAFAQAVIERLGRQPEPTEGAELAALPRIAPGGWTRAQQRPIKDLHGVDVVLDWDTNDRNPDVLVRKLESLTVDSPLDLVRLSNAGIPVHPPANEAGAAAHCTDHWTARFLSPEEEPVAHGEVLALLARFEAVGLDFTGVDHLYTFDGQPGFE